MKEANVIALAAFLLCGSVNTAYSAEQKRVPVSEEQVKQKISYFSNLITKGIAAKKIMASGDEAEIKNLDKAKAMLAEAQADIDNAKYEAADKKLGEALAVVSAASRRVEGGKGKNDRLVAIYDARKETIDSFLKTYMRVSEEKGQAALAKAQEDDVRKIISKADGLVAANNVEEGRVELEKAYKIITVLTADLREGDTLVRELRFDTPKDEYLYEVDRNESLFSVLEMVVKEKQPAERYAGKIAEMREEAEKIRAEADDLANQEKYKEGMERLNVANRTLIKAVRMAGLFIPG